MRTISDEYLTEGEVFPLVGESAVLHIRFDQQLQGPSGRDGVRVEPASLLQDSRWFTGTSISGEPWQSLQLILEPIRLGQVVTVTVPAGIRAESGAVVGRDHVFRLTRVSPPDYTVHVEGEGLIPIPGTVHIDLPGVKSDFTETQTWMSLTGRIAIRYDFDRPMDRASVERRVREQLQEADPLSLNWDRPNGLRVEAVLPEQPYGPGPGYGMDMYGVPDIRNVPVMSDRAVQVIVAGKKPLWRWRPDHGPEESGVIPGFASPKPYGIPGVVYQDKALLWSNLGEAGRPVSRPVFGYVDATWLPGGSGFIFKDNATVGLYSPRGDRVRTLATAGAGWFLGLAVDQGGERLALFRGLPSDTGDGPVAPQTKGAVDLLVLDRDGRIVKEIPGISPLTSSDGFWQEVNGAWLPDGRLAAIRRQQGGLMGELVLVDVEAGEVRVTGRPANHMAAVPGPGAGRLLIHDEAGWWIVDPVSGEEEAVPLPSHMEGMWASRLSPDGRYLAFLPDDNQVGLWDRLGNRWLDLGAGKLIGWDTDESTLYWIGE